MNATIEVIRTQRGSYNIFGVVNGEFVLEGNLTLAQLKKLQAKVDFAILQADTTARPKKEQKQERTEIRRVK